MCLHVNARQDPTQTTTARKQAFRSLHKAKREALKEIIEYINQVPRESREIPDGPITNRRVYIYELNDFDPYDAVREILERWFGTGGEGAPPNWFMEQSIADVVRRASTVEAQRMNAMAGAAGQAEPYNIASILTSPEYLERIRRVRQRVFNEMRGFTGDTANDLARTLAESMAAGRGITRVREEVSERFGIDMSRAETIARTELAKAHRDTRIETDLDARDRLGLNVKMQWISQLSPTTRPDHAAMHLQIMEIEDVQSVYDRLQGSSINCLCIQQAVLVDDDGNIVGDPEWTDRDRNEVEKLIS